jgi:hypothetical protein
LAAIHEESAADDAFAICGCVGVAFSLELLLLQSRDKASDAASEVRESEHRCQMLGGKPSSPNAQECYPKLHGGTPTFLLGCIMESMAHGFMIPLCLLPAFCFRSCSLTTTMTTTNIHSSHDDEAPFSPHFITTTIPVVVVVVVFCLPTDQSVVETPFHLISAVDSQTHFSDPFFL